MSRFLADEVRETLDVEQEKLIVIPNAVDLATFNPNIDGRTIRDKYQIHEPVILFAGRLWYVKGLHVLLLAFKKLLEDHPTVKLMIIGDGLIRNELLQITRRLKIDDNVLFIGAVPYRDMPLYIAACDVFVLPSVFEGQGIAALEAMSCGKPIVATAAGGLPEVVRDGENGFLVKPYDVEALTKALKTLIENEELRKKIGFRGREIVEEKYNWHDIADKILETYTKVLLTEFDTIH